MRISVPKMVFRWLAACGVLAAGAVVAAVPLTRDDVWGEPGATAELLLREPWGVSEPAGEIASEWQEEQNLIAGSLRCRGCHFFDANEMAQMEKFARRKHERARERRKLCLECHYRADICCH